MTSKISKDGVTAEFVDVTPELAGKWLEANTHNRNLRYRVVDSYATDMEAGDWDLNGETIKFDINGVLIDGQHRLESIVGSETTVTLLVVRGLDPDVQATVDRGIARKFADQLRLNKVPNYVTTAAITRAVCLWNKGVRRAGGGSISAKELQRTLELHPEIHDYSTKTQLIYTRCGLPASLVGLAMYVLYQIEPKDAEYFFDKLATGSGLSTGHPIYELRKRINELRSIRGKSNIYALTALTFKAWNLFRQGNTTMQVLSFRAGGAAPETFPEPM